MEELKYKMNIVMLIATIGGIIALVGVIMAAAEFPIQVGFMDILVFALAVIVAAIGIKPANNKNSSLVLVAIGLLMIFIGGYKYFIIGNYVEAESFMDVGLGVWLMIAGSIIYTIFCISDWSFKRKG